MKYIILFTTILILGGCKNKASKLEDSQIAVEHKVEKEHSEITNDDLTNKTTQPPYLPLEEIQKIDEKRTLSEFPTNQNDIRFGDWTEEDWYDNDYFRFLRQTFNDCLEGKIEIEGLIPYKSLLSSKFVIG